MQTKLSQAFSDCIERIRRGESATRCLAGYPELRPQLVPLLHTAFSLSALPRAVPSDGFRTAAKACLLARIRERYPEESAPATSLADILKTGWRALERFITGPGRVAIPSALVLILALQALFVFGTAGVGPASPALTAHGTLSAITGSVQVQRPDSAALEDARDGLTLAAGTRVVTAAGSSALLTFFNGTTIKLEPGTDLTIEQLKGNAVSKPSVIVMKQWVGKTFSRVTKLVDASSRYEIATPTGIALVRGTQFITEVDAKGKMTVQTLEGLVGVSAQGKEVYVPAGQKTMVEPGAAPADATALTPDESKALQQGATPAPVPPADNGKPPAQGQSGSNQGQPGTAGNQVVKSSPTNGFGALSLDDQSFTYGKWFFLGMAVLLIAGMIIIWRHP